MTAARGSALKAARDAWNGVRRMAGGVLFAEERHLKPFRMGRELTNSARATFLNCQQKYQFSYVYGLAPRKVQVPFLVGGLFHDELDRMYTSGGVDEDGMRGRVAKACEAACKFPGVRAEDSDAIWAQQAVVAGMVLGYERKYLKDDLRAYKVLETEGSFEAPLPGGWVYRGKKDMVVQRKSDGKVLLFEHKTAGRIDAGYVAKLPMDNQILGYAWARRKMAGDLAKFDGVVYNVTKKPGIRLRQSESMALFNARVEQEYKDNPAAYFYRELLSFSDADLDRFEAELVKFVTHVDAAQRSGDFTQNAGHCTAMGTCPFMRLCLEGVNKETLLGYRVKERAHEELPQEDENGK